MKKFLTQGRLAALIVFAVLLIDQVIKIWIKTHMYLHENIHVTDWFYIYFTENNGMAFGMEVLPKLFLTLFRIVAVVLITWYLHKITTQKDKLKTGYVVCLAFILAGAIGNIIDCVCYGEIFSESTHYQIASWVPVGQGYADWLHGRVVDMFYFPIIDTHCRNGCLSGEENVSYSLARSLILLMQQLVVALSACLFFIAVIWAMVLILKTPKKKNNEKTS